MRSLGVAAVGVALALLLPATASAGTDRLIGPGNDILVGGPGDDVCGGPGDDIKRGC